MGLLVVDPGIARELHFTAEQSAAMRGHVARHNAELEQALQKLSQNSDGQPVLEQASTLIERYRREADEQVAAQLGPSTMRRLEQIRRQLAGVSTLVLTRQLGGLGLSAEQLTRFQRSSEEVERQVDLFRRRKEREALEAVLTPRQKSTLTDLLGGPLEFSPALPLLPLLRSGLAAPGIPGMGAGAPAPVRLENEPVDLQPADATP